MEPLLTLDTIRCDHGATPVVQDLSLHLRPGQLACLLGPSGCGKTTVLRAIAGFEPVQAGEIRLQGRCLSRPGYQLPPEQRGVGMVFQDYALFPHLTVLDNVAFGLRRLGRREARRQARELLALVDLPGFGDRYPHQLSGGQQQRVALARALAPRPSLVLLDEPFSNLDRDLRERLALEVRDLLRQRGTAALFVTHDQQEAFTVAERIGVLHQGRLRQWADPYDLYHQPADRLVADFVGPGRFLEATLVAPDQVDSELGRLAGHVAYPWPLGLEVDLLLRPDDLALGVQGPRARIVERAFRGAETLYSLRLPSGRELLALTPSHQDYPLGAEVPVSFRGEHLILFPRDPNDE